MPESDLALPAILGLNQWPSPSPPQVFAHRRRQLQAQISGVGYVTSGLPRPRNYPAQTYSFRAESHFAYLVGPGLSGAVLRLTADQETLFLAPPNPDDSLWSGPQPSLSALEQSLGLPVRPLSSIPKDPESGVLPTPDVRTASWLGDLLGRPVPVSGKQPLQGPDLALAKAIIAGRLRHDSGAIAQMRQAASVTRTAHLRAMAGTFPGLREAHIRALLEASATGCGMGLAYAPIVSQRGEVLHQEQSKDLLQPGELLLVDFGVETPEGWASDVTRTWPVSGRFSPSQRALYEVVLATQHAAINAVGPGVRYREIHRIAQRELTRGLLELGILRGDLDALVEADTGSLFFPHGIGHLLGLDVHDMEDLGDLASYGPGRSRSASRSERYLRLDLDLTPGMVVTIEPGFYQIEAILNDPAQVGASEPAINRAVLGQFADVRGIRIEDDVLVTACGREVLTLGIPKTPEDVEAAVGLSNLAAAGPTRA